MVEPRSSIGARTFVLRGGMVLDPDGFGRLTSDLFVSEGVLSAVEAGVRVPAGTLEIEIPGCFVSPGFLDMHVHLREPGQEPKETIESGTRAAASGGFTGVACMPNTEPPIDTVGTLELVLRKASDAGHAHVFPIAAITRGRRGEQLAEMAELSEAGAVGFSDDGSPVVNSGLMRRAMEYAAALSRPILSHSEDLSLSAGGVMNEGCLSLRLGLKGIPREAEELGVFRDLLLARKTGCHLHVCHVSTRGSVEAIRRAKQDGVRVTAEAAPHHFTLTEEAVDGYRTNAKMNPPLRTDDDVHALLDGLVDGTLDAIATDHAPHTGEEKEAEFDRAPFGIIGLETALGLSVSALVRPGLLSEGELVRKLSVNPRRILGLSGYRLELGEPAELTVWNPDLRWRVSPEDIESRSANTPFLGSELTGRSVLTVSKGKVTFWRDSLVSNRS
jgi:dihydroorotase